MPGQAGVGCPSFGGQRTAAASRATLGSRAVYTLRMNGELNCKLAASRWAGTVASVLSLKHNWPS